jgi:hypothetical protein
VRARPTTVHRQQARVARIREPESGAGRAATNTDGHLLTNMMPRSLKALDLLRDPRVYVHSAVRTKDATEGKFKLAGHAALLADATLRKKLDDLFWQMINWRPDPDSHYFEILAERAAYHRYGDDEIALRWHA